MEETVPVLLDTDIGSDIDDAVALAYLLQQPRCDLVGVTTVTSRPRRRASLVDAVARAAGRDDLPIFSGSPDPLLVPQHQQDVPQAKVLEAWPHRKDFEPYQAVPYLRETIRSRPGELTLLTIGPLTNIAILFALDPEIPRLLKRLVMMAGVFRGRPSGRYLVREWNARLDPHASAIVFNAPLPELRTYGLDVTLQCWLESDEARARFSGGGLDLVREMSAHWRWERINFHDPLAAACLFEPDICQYARGTIEVELTSERLAGFTHWDAHDDGPHQIAVDVDPDRFFEHYFDVVGRGRP